MPALPNMSLILPTDHGSPGIWDTILDATFALIDEHDHTTGKGVPIPAAALDIDADVPWNSGGDYFAITGIKALDFQPVSTSLVSSYAGALFVNSADNNLYYRTTGGTNVKIIDGVTLNVAGFTGGIGGDYSAIGALLDYDDASDTYRLRQETSAGVRQYAKAKHADLSLYEYLAAGGAVVPANAVTLKSPAALAAPYNFILPAAVPASTSLLRMSSAGQLAVSGNVDEDVTFANNRSITLQGTGYLKQGDQGDVEPFVGGGAAWYVGTGSPPSIGSGSTPDRATVPVSSTVYYPLRIGNRKRRIKSITVYGRSFTDTSTLGLWVTTGIGTGALGTSAIQVNTGLTAVNVAADGLFAARTLTLDTPTAWQNVEGGNPVWLRVSTTATGTFAVLTYVVTYDVP